MLSISLCSVQKSLRRQLWEVVSFGDSGRFWMNSGEKLRCFPWSLVIAIEKAYHVPEMMWRVYWPHMVLFPSCASFFVFLFLRNIDSQFELELKRANLFCASQNSNTDKRRRRGPVMVLGKQKCQLDVQRTKGPLLVQNPKDFM